MEAAPEKLRNASEAWLAMSVKQQLEVAESTQGLAEPCCVFQSRSLLREFPRSFLPRVAR